ncbi:unnamed protein product [Anisakis simplex]|uniref:Ovule protein n=1 Tax=Anisakis simplex TaxID=6269 RepID=A0A0M3J190_ANISI|nr:unnamed protein product [Anisakis simplex]
MGNWLVGWTSFVHVEELNGEYKRSVCVSEKKLLSKLLLSNLEIKSVKTKITAAAAAASRRQEEKPCKFRKYPSRTHFF